MGALALKPRPIGAQGCSNTTRETQHVCAGKGTRTEDNREEIRPSGGESDSAGGLGSGRRWLLSAGT